MLLLPLCWSHAHCHEEQGQMGPSVAGSLGIEAVLKARQEAHVKQFLQTEAAFQAGTTAQQQIHLLQAESDR